MRMGLNRNGQFNRNIGTAFAFALLLFGFSSFLNGQDSSVLLQWGGIKLEINSIGGLGKANKNAIEFPPNAGKYPLKKLDFWVTGIQSNGDTIAIAGDIFGGKNYWTEGPFGTINQHIKKSDWNLFSQISFAEIQQHIKSYKNSGYIAPNGIFNWPAAINIAGFPKVCAAYVDDNQNGFYDFKNGDYPYVFGTQDVLTVASDSAQKTPSKAHQTPFDLAVLWYEPTNSDSIPNTILFRLTLCNRTKDTFYGIKLSSVADFMIGNTMDDQLATHVGFNSVYAYNQQGGDAIYGANWPAVALGWLSTTASASIYFNNDNSAVQGNPTTEKEFYHYANGYWRSGKNLGSTGSGLDATSSTAKFIYPGVTDKSLGLNRNWTNKEGNAGRQTALISTQGFAMKGVGCKVVDGFVSVVPGAPDSAAVENKLKRIHNFYNGQEFTLNPNKLNPNKFVFYPNPVKSGSTIRLDNCTGKNLEIVDLAGKEIYAEKVNTNEIKIPFKPGIYILKIEGFVPQLLQILD